MDLFLPTLLNWCSKGFLNGHAFSKASMQAADRNAKFHSPISEAECFSVECNVSDERRTISGLFFLCCPFAVFRKITQRAIFSFVTVRRRRPRSHIGVKVLKRFPSFAYFDSVSAVVRKVCTIRVIATLIHLLPSNILRGVAHSVLSFAAWLASVATVPSKGRPTDRLFCSALATTGPIDMLRMVRALAENRPFSELLSRQIYETRMTLGRLVFSHDASLISRVVRTALVLKRQCCSHFSTFAIGGQI